MNYAFSGLSLILIPIFPIVSYMPLFFSILVPKTGALILSLLLHSQAREFSKKIYLMPNSLNYYDDFEYEDIIDEGIKGRSVTVKQYEKYLEYLRSRQFEQKEKTPERANRESRKPRKDRKQINKKSNISKMEKATRIPITIVKKENMLILINKTVSNPISDAQNRTHLSLMNRF
jgi:hypothetical protein